MTASQVTILGSRTNPVDDYRYQADVHSSGAVVIAEHEIIPTDSLKLNPEWSFVYGVSGTSGMTGSSIGSIYMNFPTGSYVNVLTYIDGNITKVSPWSVV